MLSKNIIITDNAELDFVEIGTNQNESDKKYYRGITSKPVFVMRSLMLTDGMTPKSQGGTGKVIMGGNFVSWYGGFDSFMLASSVTDEIYSPKMGRAIDGEIELGINQLPYLQWQDWITELSKRTISSLFEISYLIVILSASTYST